MVRSWPRISLARSAGKWNRQCAHQSHSKPVKAGGCCWHRCFREAGILLPLRLQADSRSVFFPVHQLSISLSYLLATRPPRGRSVSSRVWLARKICAQNTFMCQEGNASRLQKGHSVNSPTSRLAAASAAAYTFSTASLHTPQRPPSRKPPRVSKRNPYRPSRGNHSATRAGQETGQAVSNIRPVHTLFWLSSSRLGVLKYFAFWISILSERVAGAIWAPWATPVERATLEYRL